MKNLKMLFTSFLLLATLSCNKDKDSCYDARLYRQHKDDICTMDCPGVTGCDGKIYCNECEALRQGIRVDK